MDSLCVFVVYSRYEWCLVKSVLGFILIFALCVAAGVGLTVLYATGGLTRWVKLAQPTTAIVSLVTDNQDVFVTAENGKTYACFIPSANPFSQPVGDNSSFCLEATVQAQAPSPNHNAELPCDRLRVEFFPTTSPPLLVRQCAASTRLTPGGFWREVFAVDAFGGLWGWRRSAEAVETMFVFIGAMLFCVPGGAWLGTAWVTKRKGRKEAPPKAGDG